MIHNGIEQGHLSVFAEVHSILRHQLSLSNLEIANIFEKWSAEGELRGNYLLNIGVKALKVTKGDGVENEEGIVEGIEDKISEFDSAPLSFLLEPSTDRPSSLLQLKTSTTPKEPESGLSPFVHRPSYISLSFLSVGRVELTSFVSRLHQEIGTRHVAAPTIAAAHQLRIISADRGERLKVVKALGIAQPSKAEEIEHVDAFVETLRKAAYGAILGAFVQGLAVSIKSLLSQLYRVFADLFLVFVRSQLIARASEDEVSF